VVSLCQILANEQNNEQIRMSAGLAMKNTLTAKVRVWRREGEEFRGMAYSIIFITGIRSQRGAFSKMALDC